MSPQRNLQAGVRRLAQEIWQSTSIVLTTHQNPDGDGIGAELAMRAALMQLGKSVTILNDSGVPPEYAFLDHYHVIQRYSKARDQRQLQSADMVILLDASEPGRTGRLAPAIEAFTGRTAAIDHHVVTRWAEFGLVDPSACSTTVLVRLLLREFSIFLSPMLADALYVGILVDTMGFRNANTNSACLSLAAELVESGADGAGLWRRLFGDWPIGRLKLQGENFASLHAALGGRLVWSVIDAEMLKRHRQHESAIEGFVERTLDVRGAELALLFLEVSPDETRVSFRSREPVAIDALARDLGGGGHRLAAGATISMPRDRAVDMVLTRAREFLAQYGPRSRAASRMVT